MKIETRMFGAVEVGESTPYLKQVIQINGQPQNCGLYIADEFSEHASHCLKIAELIDDLDAIDTKARKILHQKLQDENTLVVDYLDYHVEEVANEIKDKLQVSNIDQNLLLQSLDLRAIGFHLEEADHSINLCLDYCPGEEFSDQLLVVKFRENGDLIEVAHES